MRIYVHVSKFYDWESLPEGVEPTEADVKSNRVKPALNGGWLMRVPKEMETYTDIQLPEAQLVALIVQDAFKEGNFYDRCEAAGHYLARHVAQHHFHRSWITKIEVQDDGPVPEIFEEEFERIRAANHLQVEDHEPLLEKYTTEFTTDDLVAAFMARFNVKPKKEVK